MKHKKPKTSEANKAFRYKPQFGVIVICEDEKKQEAIFNRLQQEGHQCKIVVV